MDQKTLTTFLFSLKKKDKHFLFWQNEMIFVQYNISSHIMTLKIPITEVKNSFNFDQFPSNQTISSQLQSMNRKNPRLEYDRERGKIFGIKKIPFPMGKRFFSENLEDLIEAVQRWRSLLQSSFHKKSSPFLS